MYMYFEIKKERKENGPEKVPEELMASSDNMKKVLNCTRNHASKVEDVCVFHLRNFTSTSVVWRSIHI